MSMQKKRKKKKNQKRLLNFGLKSKTGLYLQFEILIHLTFRNVSISPSRVHCIGGELEQVWAQRRVWIILGIKRVRFRFEFWF